MKISEAFILIVATSVAGATLQAVFTKTEPAQQSVSQSALQPVGIEQKFADFNRCMQPAVPQGMRLETTSFDQVYLNGTQAQYTASGSLYKSTSSVAIFGPTHFPNDGRMEFMNTNSLTAPKLNDRQLKDMTYQLRRCNASVLGILPAIAPTR